jgi:hypothetical protein
MWLAVYKPKRFGLSWFTNWVRANAFRSEASVYVFSRMPLL